ncbi:hypothetical protein HC251_05940 [Iamia sp. SCSIO 61187]|uniref:C69 family dipeptidase n=1 Tax=Iamia sp. SCSIO 61187 TaxID=2722752 RepID=UPI001C624B7E|nr:C69 family dipeptidase [Iamia sp. SCSIO 61187]QYG92022.1 hypothetical protein HC251_05940 [Iamia sp. SCSIO 61187]
MCDTMVALAAATADGVTLFAKNSDRPPHERQVLEHVPSRREDVTTTTYLTIPGPDGPTLAVAGSRPTWMWGMEHGVNEAGVAVGNEMIFTTDDPRQAPAALTGMDLVRLALERSGTADEGVATITGLIERHGQGGSGHDHDDVPYWSSFLVADPTTAWVVETSGRTWEAEEVTATRAISNRTTIPAFDALHRAARQATGPFVDPRWEACTGALGERPVTEAGLRRHLRRHVGGDEGWTVCMHVDGLEATTASVVAALPPDRPPVARLLLGSPCRSVYVPLRVGEAFRSPDPERFAALTDDDRPALAALEAELDAALAAHDGPGWNDEALRRVDTALTAMGR